MPDGTAIGRVRGLEENAALRKYFRENVLNTEGYINYMDRLELDEFYTDGRLDPSQRAGVERSLYLKWLSATYGKTKMEKFGDWLVTKEGRHTALDAVGLFFDPADGANAVLYMLEGDWGNAGLSGISMIPLIGDYFGKGGKGAKHLLKLADLTKLDRNKKVLKVLEDVDVFIKARKADLGEVRRLLKESWEDLIDGGIYAERYVTPDGMVYWVRRSDDFRVNINLMDEAGDTIQDTWQAGRKLDTLEGYKISREAIEQGKKITKFTYPDDPIRDILGRGIDSDPEEWQRIIRELEDNDVEIVYREGVLGYAPHPSINGKPGQFLIDPNAIN